MNRRQMFMGAMAVPLLSMVPAPLLARRLNPHVIFHAAAMDHPQAELVAATCRAVVEEGKLYTTGDFSGMGHFITLRNPLFVVHRGGRVWNWMTGYTEEEGLVISCMERGVDLGETMLFTSKGYEDYFSTLERDPKRHPDYGIKAFHTPYELRAERREYDPRRVSIREIEARLPKGDTGMDMRWLEATIAEEKKAQAA